MPRSRRGMMAARTARGDIIAFFESVMERRFSEAERALNAVREKPLGNEEFKAGYLNALEGILVSTRSGDERDFINKVPFDAKSMEKYKRKFRSFVREGVRTPFDMGYFSAWSDFMHYRLNTEK
ncbi:MAG: hypothetical protein ACE5OO_00805 [Candidatus Bathyarchaeia archaeon]